jgi:hypothetical protein
MSETRKVCLSASPRLRTWSRCQTPQAVVVDGGGVLVDLSVWRVLPREAQCRSCLAHGASRERASPAHILAVSLFLGGLAGWCDAQLTSLIADATLDPAAAPVLLDLAERRSLHMVGSWEARSVEWPTRDEHGTGDNPHVWLDTGRWMPGRNGAQIATRQCPCGAYEGSAAASPRMFVRDPEVVDQCGQCGAVVEGYHACPGVPDETEAEDPTTISAAIGYG